MFYVNQNTEGNQSLKNVQYGLEIIFKLACSHLFTWLEWGTVRG